MKNEKSKLEIMIGPGLVILLVLVGIGALYFYRQPLGPALESPDFSVPVITQAPEVVSAPVVADLPATSTAPEPTDPPEPTSAPTTMPVQPASEAPATAPRVVCGESGVWNILVIGSDAADMFGTPGSDLTRVIRVDFPNKKVSIFAFSRDLWVDASGLGLQDPDITNTKLGMVFYEARRRSTEKDPQDTMQEGINAMATTLATNFGLNYNHYIGMDLDKLPSMIETIGGVPINIPTTLTDPRTGTVFSAGPQILSGDQTAIYASANLGSDLNRIERNNLLLEALRHKVLDPTVWIRVPTLFIQFRHAINTDLSLEQVNHLVCLLKEVDEETIIQDGVKEEWTTPGPEGSLLWDEAKILGRLQELGMLP